MAVLGPFEVFFQFMTLQLAGSWFDRFLPAKRGQTMPVLSTVEAQLLLHKHNIAKEPQKHQETGG